MKKNENTKLNRSWMAAFSVATTAFAAHAGGGFATGNQENTWFVSLGLASYCWRSGCNVTFSNDNS